MTRCLLFLTGFYFLVVFPSGFGFSLHGWAWWPYLTAMVSVLLLSCCCDTVELGWPGASKPGPGHQCGVRDVSVTACSPSYVRPLQYPLSFSFLLPLLLNVSHPLCVKTGVGRMCDCALVRGCSGWVMERRKSPLQSWAGAPTLECRDGETGVRTHKKICQGLVKGLLCPAFALSVGTEGDRDDSQRFLLPFEERINSGG